MEEALTKKEASELQPRIKDALLTFFKYADKGIGATTQNKQAKEVFIWSSIDDSEADLIARSLVETGQKSKAVATVTRQISRNYSQLQMGIILIPRFIMSVQHYMQNGFSLPFGKGGSQ